jgi:hypothetical protein
MYAIVGFIVVLISFFTLPFKFMARSHRELSEIGRRGKVEVDDLEELPLLTWLLVLGRCLVSIGAVLTYLFLILAASASDSENSSAAVVAAIIFGPLASIAVIWFYGLLLEFISLQVVVARNTRLTHEAIRGGARRAISAEAPTPSSSMRMSAEPAGQA